MHAVCIRPLIEYPRIPLKQLFQSKSNDFKFKISKSSVMITIILFLASFPHHRSTATTRYFVLPSALGTCWARHSRLDGGMPVKRSDYSCERLTGCTLFCRHARPCHPTSSHGLRKTLLELETIFPVQEIYNQQNRVDCGDAGLVTKKRNRNMAGSLLVWVWFGYPLGEFSNKL